MAPVCVVIELNLNPHPSGSKKTSRLSPHFPHFHRTSAASLVLFDKDKKVIWKAP